MNTESQAARLPPTGLIGLNPAWSRLVTTTDHSGVERTWHALDNGIRSALPTLLCVHGNPNWSYMWRRLVGEVIDRRVVAIDALNMGFSERTGSPKRLADHVDDLRSVTDAMGIDGPVVTIAHDWGGPISMGWALANLERVDGVVLMNTGVARPANVKVPPLISIARATLQATCVTTPAFVHGAFRMARPQLAPDVYGGYTAPFRDAAQRSGIRDFVEDIPIDDTHQTHETLAAIASGLGQLNDTPSLLLWGAKDLIFSDAFLSDLQQRLPHADVHRFADAAHQIVEDTEAIDVIQRWLTSNRSLPPAPKQRPRMWSAIEERRDDRAAAIVEMDEKEPDRIARSISFAELGERVDATARGLLNAGVRPGDRLATLVPPGIDLTVVVYACLRAGITMVLPDAALGIDGLRRALRSSRPDFVVGDWRGLLVAKSLRLPAERLRVDQLEQNDGELPVEPSPEKLAAIVFTSGSTGPSKGVRYTHGQLEAQRDVLIDAFGIDPTDTLVVAFAPFALLAPAVGIQSVIPNMDVTAPSKLRASTLGQASNAVGATIAFASPAVLANIAATAHELDSASRQALEAIRAVVTAGAPVSPQLLVDIQPVFPNADVSTPYGMTEVLPVTVADKAEIQASGAGVCVGVPLPGVDVAVRPIEAPSGSTPLPVRPGVLGEVWIRAEHASSNYDGLWAAEHHAFVDGWHRSGDVGHLDELGRLWIEGRVDHLIHTAAGSVAPVHIELQAESVTGVEHAAAVGVGPVGTQQLAVVVRLASGERGPVASPEIAASVRAAVGTGVAAVLVAPTIPVDRRHNSKIDRSRVQAWAEAILGGATRAKL